MARKADNPAENPFDVLGVDLESDTEEIRLAYRSAARRHHPDRGGDPERFAQIAAAYRLLRGGSSRARQRAAWRDAASASGDEDSHVDAGLRRAARRWVFEPWGVGVLAAVSALFVLSLLVTWTVAGPLLFAVVVVASAAVGGIAATLRHLMGG